MRTPPRRKYHIALAFPSGNALGERVQQGIASYAAERGGWVFTRLPELMHTSIEWLRDWRGDGAFVFITNAKENQRARSLSLPIVNLSSHIAHPAVPTVSSDHRETGRIGAEHLLSKHFQNLAFYGTEGLHYSDERRWGFLEAIPPKITTHQLTVPMVTGTNFRWRNQENALDHWLRKLPRPVGIFAGTDLRATMVLQACERVGLQVPREVAVLGVDNDPLVCEDSQPPLSSVSRNNIEVGRQAARVLEDLMAGRETTDWVRIEPDGVIQRESTNTLAITDPLIAQAIERIQLSLHKPFGVSELMAELTVSRRHFETSFRAALGRSPYAFINDLRVENAKILLEKETNRSLKDIAAACGFTSARRFGLVFQRTTGCRPGEWREKRLSRSL